MLKKTFSPILKKTFSPILLIVSFVVLSFVILAGVALRDADAISAFARKYQTSCNTCHIAFPKLTAFGEAFRRNGYQFPERADPEFLKEEPVSLGAEAYKEVFPNAIWPGAIPHLPAIAVVTEGELLYLPEAEKGEQKLSFDATAAEVEVLMSGTVSENISFFWELEFEGDESEVEVGTISFSNLLASRLKPNLLNLRIGKFVPEFVANGHRGLATHHPWLGGKNVGDNKWALLRTQKGIELSGVASGRLGYDVGLVEGRKNLPNSDKDFYAHLAYKLGGMRLDGVTKGESPLEVSEPWIDDSITIGGFVYLGFADIEAVQVDKTKKPQEDNFQMFGGDLSVFIKDLNLLGGVALEHHSQPTAKKEAMNALHIFGEADYILYPWLVPVVRFEAFNLEGETDMRILPIVNILLRANVKAIIAAEIEKEGDEGFEVGEIEAALATGF